MRVVFFGSGAFGLPTLSALLRAHDVVLVVTQPDRPAGRRRTLTSTPISHLAAERTVPIFKPPRPNEAESTERIRAARADVFVVIAYGHKLRPSLLEDTFAVNLHGSLLPKFRGAAPINWAIIEGERETGLSVITLAQRMDAGAVLASCATSIDPMETAGELHDRLAELGPALVLDTLARHEANELDPRPQNEAFATAAPKMTRADGTVRFDMPAPAVRCRIHGLTPWPGCTVHLAGRPLKLLRARPAEDDGASPLAPGCVRSDHAVQCSPGALRLLSVQPAGGRSMSFEAYRNGHEVPDGARMDPA